ncbi:hypothetical protein H257_07623 [Aphanomyces astaci]|uniref:Uncharacterized protein n=1 Tax=Aphanomyces astaci TaxID=112090 RepID=W4GIM3_APHAT|nr:hypothetical protein H257_07623 [Aphanomyces astaci]ETV78793.1 hypothetical protein H257_07623 [Aphanomyces astaci]|eukprot:XP_009831512.1 hypothetical protein H257_07623 [Aphanomyces astaci]
MKLGLVLGLDGAGKTMLLRQLSHMRKDEFHNTKLGSVFEKVRTRLFADSASAAEVDGIDVATLPTTGVEEETNAYRNLAYGPAFQQIQYKCAIVEQCRIELTRILARVLRFTEAGLWIFRQTEKLVIRSLCRSSSYDGVSGVREDFLSLPAKPVVRTRVKTNVEWHSIEHLHVAAAKRQKRK